MREPMDMEQRAELALGAMSGLEELIAGQHQCNRLDPGNLSRLLEVVFGAVREAIPQEKLLRRGSNDYDD